MKRSIYLIAILCLSALALAACSSSDDADSDGGANPEAAADVDGSASDGESTADVSDDDGSNLDDILADLPIDDDGNFDPDAFEDLNFGRASDEAFAIAAEGCTLWAVWDVDEGQSSLGDILALATEARELDDIRDPVLVRFEGDVSSLMLALQRGDGSGVINLNSRVIDEDCSAIF